MGQINSSLFSLLDLLLVIALSTVNKPAASTGKGASNSIIGPLLKAASAKLAQSTLVGSGKTRFILSVFYRIFKVLLCIF